MSQAVSAFRSYSGDEVGSRPWGPSVVASSVVYLAIGLAAMILGGKKAVQIAKKAVDVTFVEKVVKEAPPPPPPAPVIAKPQPPAAMAAIARPDQKVIHLDKPPPPKQLTVPKEMPKEAAKEADPSLDKGVKVYGEGKGDAAGLEGGVTQGGTLGGQVGGAIALPEDAVAPTPLASNTVPPYPQEARASGKTGTVILKVVILADGRVADVQVMRGEEPFVSAAVNTVKGWRYAPAQYKGQAITVYRIIQIPFKLTA
jgi:protein TonB